MSDAKQGRLAELRQRIIRTGLQTILAKHIGELIFVASEEKSWEFKR